MIDDYRTDPCPVRVAAESDVGTKARDVAESIGVLEDDKAVAGIRRQIEAERRQGTVALSTFGWTRGRRRNECVVIYEEASAGLVGKGFKVTGGPVPANVPSA